MEVNQRRLQANFSPLVLDDKDIVLEKNAILVKVAHSGTGDNDIRNLLDRIVTIAECIDDDKVEIIPLDIFLEMNFISDEGVKTLINTLSFWSSSNHEQLKKVQLRRLRLHMCRVSDSGCEKLADYILSCRRERLPSELHLSHNRIGTRGCVSLLQAAGQKYPRLGTGNPPLWLRLEHNYIDVKEVRKIINKTTRWCECVPMRCSPLSCARSSAQLPIHVHLPHFLVQRAAATEVSLTGISDLLLKAKNGSTSNISKVRGDKGEEGLFASNKMYSATARESVHHSKKKEEKTSLSSTFPPSLLTRPRVDPVVPLLVSMSVVPKIPIIDSDLTPEMIDSFLTFPEDEKSEIKNDEVDAPLPSLPQTPLPSVQDFILNPSSSPSSTSAATAAVEVNPSTLVSPTVSTLIETTPIPLPPPLPPITSTNLKETSTPETFLLPPPPPPPQDASTPSHLFVVLDTSAVVRMMDPSFVFSFDQLGLTKQSSTSTDTHSVGDVVQEQSITFVVLETVLQQLDANKQAPFMYGTRERIPSAHVNAMRLHVNAFFKLYPSLEASGVLVRTKSEDLEDQVRTGGFNVATAPGVRLPSGAFDSDGMIIDSSLVLLRALVGGNSHSTALLLTSDVRMRNRAIEAGMPAELWETINDDFSHLPSASNKDESSKECLLSSVKVLNAVCDSTRTLLFSTSGLLPKSKGNDVTSEGIGTSSTSSSSSSSSASTFMSSQNKTSGQSLPESIQTSSSSISSTSISMRIPHMELLRASSSSRSMASLLRELVQGCTDKDLRERVVSAIEEAEGNALIWEAMHREKRRASSLHAALYNDGTEGGGGESGLATRGVVKASAIATSTIHHQLPTEPRNDKGAHPSAALRSSSLPQKQPRLDQQQQLHQQKLNRDSVLQQSKEPMKKFSQPVFKSDISHTFKPVVVPNQNQNQTYDQSGVKKAPAKAGKKNAINNNNVKEEDDDDDDELIKDLEKRIRQFSVKDELSSTKPSSLLGGKTATAKLSKISPPLTKQHDVGMNRKQRRELRRRQMQQKEEEEIVNRRNSDKQNEFVHIHDDLDDDEMNEGDEEDEDEEENIDDAFLDFEDDPDEDDEEGEDEEEEEEEDEDEDEANSEEEDEDDSDEDVDDNDVVNDDEEEEEEEEDEEEEEEEDDEVDDDSEYDTDNVDELSNFPKWVRTAISNGSMVLRREIVPGQSGRGARSQLTLVPAGEATESNYPSRTLRGRHSGIKKTTRINKGKGKSSTTGTTKKKKKNTFKRNTTDSDDDDFDDEEYGIPRKYLNRGTSRGRGSGKGSVHRVSSSGRGGGGGGSRGGGRGGSSHGGRGRGGARGGKRR
jgi:hypothetical protein